MTDVISITQLMRKPRLLGPHYKGDSWNSWEAILCAAHGLPLTTDQEVVFRELAGGRAPPGKRVREAWFIAGRRGGKDSIASLQATHSAVTDHRAKLRPGEIASVVCTAVDKAQAGILRRMVGGNFEQTAALKPLVSRTTLGGFELGALSAEVEIVTSDYRSIRGRAISCMVCDEIAFWAQNADNAGQSDAEVINAALPALATLDGMLVGISTPWGRRGILYERWRKYFGQDDPDVLVIQASTRQLNPTIPQEMVDAAMERDPVSASAEWMGQFRSDIDSYISAEILDANIAHGCFERLPEQRVHYAGFVDMSGGSIDSSALCIAHKSADDRTIVDVIREVRAPHSPMAAVQQFCEVLRAYRISNVTGDRYGAEWVSEQFRHNGISYVASERNKSAIYTELVPLLSSRKLELLDNERMHSQFLGLERRTGSSGKDTIDHGPGGKDDVCNAVAGCCVLVGGRPDAMAVFAALKYPAGAFAGVPQRVFN